METGSIRILKLEVMPEPIAGFLKRKLAHKLPGFLNLKRSPGKHEKVESGTAWPMYSG